MSSPDDARPEGPPPGDVAPIESEPVGAEVPQPPAAADDAHPGETTSDSTGTGVDSAAPQVDDAPQAEHPVDDTASTSAAAPEQPAAAPTPSTDPEAVPAPAHDELRTPVLEALQKKLGDAVIAAEMVPGRELCVRIRLDAWGETARILRQELGFTYFCFLSAIDWLPSPYGKSEDDTAPPAVDPNAPLDHGTTGGETRFQLLARVEKPGTGLGLTLKTDVGADLVAPTWSHIYLGANWHERETWEMFGVTFAGHPHLVHLYLPGEFEGFPLRKDFPLISRMVKPWPGLVDVEPMPGEPDDEEAAEAADA